MGNKSGHPANSTTTVETNPSDAGIEALARGGKVTLGLAKLLLEGGARCLRRIELGTRGVELPLQRGSLGRQCVRLHVHFPTIKADGSTRVTSAIEAKSRTTFAWAEPRAALSASKAACWAAFAVVSRLMRSCIAACSAASESTRR